MGFIVSTFFFSVV